MYEELIQDIRVTFSKVEAIIIWGSKSRADSNPLYGDLDLLIITSQEKLELLQINEMQKSLSVLRDKYQSKYALDPALTTVAELNADFTLLFQYGMRPAHQIEKYQFLNDSKILFGDQNIYKQMPTITLSAALRGILPYLSNKVIPDLLEHLKLGKLTDAQFVENYGDKLIVIARNIYTIDKSKIGLKLEALHHLELQYPESRNLALRLIQYYKKIPVPIEYITEKEIQIFLETALSKFL